MKERTRKRIRKFTNPWREGRWVDRWTNVHFLTGILSGFAPVFFKMTFITGLLVFIFFVILWEIIEWYKNIKERRENQIADIFVGVLGYFFVYPVVGTIGVSVWTSVALFVGLFIYTINLAREGWLAYVRYKPYRKSKRHF